MPDYNRRKFLGVAGITGVSALTSGCLGDDDDDGVVGDDDDDGVVGDDDDGVPDDEDEVYGGDLTVAISDNPEHLFPHRLRTLPDDQVATQFANTLIRLTPDGQLEPDLAAELPEILDGGSTHVMKLREDVYFHEPYDDNMTAADVVWNFRNMLDPDYGSFIGEQFREVMLDDPEEAVEESGEYEVTFRLDDEYYFGALWYKMARPRSSILPPEAVEEHGPDDFGTLAVGTWGTGPFVLDEARRDEHFRFVRNDNYFREGEYGQLPYLDSITLAVYPEEPVRTTAVRTGEVDYVDELPWRDVEDIEDMDDVRIDSQDGTFLFFHAPNHNHEALADRQVRRALNHAVDQQELIDVQFSGYGHYTGAPFPEWHWALDEDAVTEYPYDPDRARELLEDAGYEDGFEIKMRVRNRPFYEEPAEFLQGYYSDIGVDVELEVVETARVFEYVASEWDPDGHDPDEWQGLFEDHAPDLDPEMYIHRWFQSQGVLNAFPYENDVVNEALEAALFEDDQEAAREHYSTAISQITEDAVWIPLTWPDAISAVHEDVRDVEIYTNKYLFFEEVWLDRS